MKVEIVPPLRSCSALLAFGHAIANPLSTASMRLEILERRLKSDSAPESQALAERVMAVKGDLAEAGLLLTLLPRLVDIGAEEAVSTSLAEVSRSAGIGISPEEFPTKLLIRPLATSDAIRSVAIFLSGGEPAPPSGTIESGAGSITLDCEGAGRTEPFPEGLLDLPRGEGFAQPLFLARCACEIDGGTLVIGVRRGRRFARITWPEPAERGVA